MLNSDQRFFFVCQTTDLQLQFSYWQLDFDQLLFKELQSAEGSFTFTPNRFCQHFMITVFSCFDLITVVTNHPGILV